VTKIYGNNLNFNLNFSSR